MGPAGVSKVEEGGKVMGSLLRIYVGHFSHPSVGNVTANWFLAWARPRKRCDIIIC